MNNGSRLTGRGPSATGERPQRKGDQGRRSGGTRDQGCRGFLGGLRLGPCAGNPTQKRTQAHEIRKMCAESSSTS